MSYANKLCIQTGAMVPFKPEDSTTSCLLLSYSIWKNNFTEAEHCSTSHLINSLLVFLFRIKNKNCKTSESLFFYPNFKPIYFDVYHHPGTLVFIFVMQNGILIFGVHTVCRLHSVLHVINHCIKPCYNCVQCICLLAHILVGELTTLQTEKQA